MKAICEICDFVFSEDVKPEHTLSVVQIAEKMKAHYYIFHNPRRVKLMEDKK